MLTKTECSDLFLAFSRYVLKIFGIFLEWMSKYMLLFLIVAEWSDSDDMFDLFGVNL